MHNFDWTLADEEHIHFKDDLDHANFTLTDLIHDGCEKEEMKFIMPNE